MRLFRFSVSGVTLPLPLLLAFAFSSPVWAAPDQPSQLPFIKHQAGITEPLTDPRALNEPSLQSLAPDTPAITGTLHSAYLPTPVQRDAPLIATSKNTSRSTFPKSDVKNTVENGSKQKQKPKAATARAEAETTPLTIPNNLPADRQLELKHLYEAIHESEHTVQNEVRDEEELSAKNLAMLWQASVERSATIRYAIEKLSKRDATGKPVAGDPLTKRMLQSVIHLGGVAGTIMTGSPAGVLGGGIMQEMIQSDPQDPLKVKVSDADMLILAKEVEALQAQLMTTYYTYVHKEQQYQLAQEAQNVLRLSLDKAVKQNEGATETLIMPAIGSGVLHKALPKKGVAPSSGLVNTSVKTSIRKPSSLLSSGSFETVQPLMESLVDSSTRDAANARQAYLSSKDALALLVGPDAMQALDQLEKESDKDSVGTGKASAAR